MFGLYRLVLSLLVALSHAGLVFHGFNPGQWSVVCFYVLSGLLMERQFRKLAVHGGTIAFCIESDEELNRLEGRHVCPEKALAELLAQEKCTCAKPQVN